MELIFLDECGSPLMSHDSYLRYARKLDSAKQQQGPFPPYPWFAIAAVKIPESKYKAVEDWYERIRRSFLNASPHENGSEWEVKGSTLYALREGKIPLEWTQLDSGRKSAVTAKRRTVWAPLTDVQLRSLEQSIFDLLGRIRPTIWVVAIKQAHVYRRYGVRTWKPTYWALTYLQQRVAQHMEANHGSYDRALFIMDETSTLSTAAHYQEFFETRRTINRTASWPTDFQACLVDVPVGAKSHLFAPLQLADIVAHTIWRHLRKTDSLGWFEQIEPYLDRHWSTGRYERAGLTVIQ